MKTMYVVVRISPFSLSDQLIKAFGTYEEAKKFIQEIPGAEERYGQWDVFPNKNDTLFTYRYSGTYCIERVEAV